MRRIPVRVLKLHPRQGLQEPDERLVVEMRRIPVRVLKPADRAVERRYDDERRNETNTRQGTETTLTATSPSNPRVE